MGSIIPTVCAAATLFSILTLGFLMVVTAENMEHNLIGGILLIGGALTLLSSYFAGLFVLVWGEDYLKRKKKDIQWVMVWEMASGAWR